jgi:hypothetical protein
MLLPGIAFDECGAMPRLSIPGSAFSVYTFGEPANPFSDCATGSAG